MNEIFIICNSIQAVKEISVGNWPLLPNANIFTCNMSYSFFKTTARHLNMFSDAAPIKRFLEAEDWLKIYNTWQYTGIEFIISEWDIKDKCITVKKHQNCKANTKFSPICVPGSSGINALLYSALVEGFEKIHLIGYTINEWDGIEHVKELHEKQAALNQLHAKYQVNKIRDFVYEFTKK